MSNFPTTVSVISSDTTTALQKSNFEQWLDTTRQLPGASAPRKYTIENEAFTALGSHCLLELPSGSTLGNLSLVDTQVVESAGRILYLNAASAENTIVIKNEASGLKGRLRTLNGNDMALPHTGFASFMLDESGAWVQQMDANIVQSVADAMILVAPPGLAGWFIRQTPPTGWLKANGALLDRTTYAPLFAAIGTTFGAGDGETTFQLPDLRGEFPRGWDDGRGVDPGRAFGSAQGDALQQITGQINCGDGSIGYLSSNSTGVFSAVTATTANFLSGPGLATTRTWQHRFDSANVTRSASETRSRNVAMLACIKY